MKFFTGKGDQGKTILMDGIQRSKGDPVFEILGILDEACAHLGMAISLCDIPEITADMVEIQRQLSTLMGIMASYTTKKGFNGELASTSIVWLENKINHYSAVIKKPKSFVPSGSSTLGAAIDISRTVIRRAERNYVHFSDSDKSLGENVISTFLNRLSSLLFIIRLYSDNYKKNHPNNKF